ncbi:HD domain-containing protein, partial [bacterium]|nr:HD domain-containing protein [bacterium]
MITKELLEVIHEAASIQRWNDHIRPIELTELDKQAHKMVIAFVVAKFEEEDKEIDYRKLIEGGLFEFLHRIILTDIKPPVFHKLMARKGRQLNEWVLSQLNDIIADIEEGFTDRFKRYLFENDYAAIEKRILKAAHYLATNWEFKIIYALNSHSYGIDRTKAEIDNELEDYFDLIGVGKLSLFKKSYHFIDLCGQLRFQQRWAQTPRIPKTSVLGHMLIVAILSYLCSLQLKACPKRLYNNYFAALFHDIPEALTRDIVSPVKRSVEGLEEIIKEYEQTQLEEKILPLLPSTWHKEMRYFLTDEFRGRILKDGEKEVVAGPKIDKLYNQDEYSPIDGEIIKACDNLAAYIEASLSLEHGIKS